MLWGYGFQFVSALLLLRWDTGRQVLDYVSSRMILFVSYSYTDGSNFVFGWLWNPPNICGMYPVLAFEVARSCQILHNKNYYFQQAMLPILFFVSFIFVMYYFGIIQIVLKWYVKIKINYTLLILDLLDIATNIFIINTPVQ